MVAIPPESFRTMRRCSSPDMLGWVVYCTLWPLTCGTTALCMPKRVATGHVQSQFSTSRRRQTVSFLTDEKTINTTCTFVHYLLVSVRFTHPTASYPYRPGDRRQPPAHINRGIFDHNGEHAHCMRVPTFLRGRVDNAKAEELVAGLGFTVDLSISDAMPIPGATTEKPPPSGHRKGRRRRRPAGKDIDGELTPPGKGRVGLRKTSMPELSKRLLSTRGVWSFAAS